MLQPSFANGGLLYPAAMMHSVRKRTKKRRWIRILSKSPNVK